MRCDRDSSTLSAASIDSSQLARCGCFRFQKMLLNIREEQERTEVRREASQAMTVFF